MPDGVAGPTAMEGMKAHKSLQKELLSQDDSSCALEAEVSLNYVCNVQGRDIKLRGRIDLADTANARLYEIKSAYVPAEKIPESQIRLQWAQLYLYGYVFMLCEQQRERHHAAIDLELIHVNLRDNHRSSEHRCVSGAELTEHAQAALRLYVQWIEQVEHRQQRMSHSAAVLDFPFDAFRPGQRDLAAAVFRASRDSAVVMCEAPTGIGKTISTMFPAFKSMSEGQISQFAYLTAKVAGSLSALQALARLHQQGLEFTAIQLRSKQATCFCSNGRCERDSSGRCPMTLGFFDRLADARAELLQLGMINGDILDDVAWQHQLCPFELSQQMLPWVHVVIADYNYVFDPLVRLPYFSVSNKQTLLLIDEAHNLLDRSRSMFSGVLGRLQCLQEAEQCQSSHPVLARSLIGLSERLLKSAPLAETQSEVALTLDTTLQKSVSRTLNTLIEAMGDDTLLPESSGELFKVLCRFVVISELAGDNHRCITRWEKQGRHKEVTVTLYCLDASSDLASLYKQYRALVLFSGTLRPAAFYRDTLGLPDSCAYLQLRSPFENRHAYRAVINWVDTRYHQRQTSLASLVELIHAATSHTAGNYMVFFPSHSYLQQVHRAFSERFPEIDTWAQERDQSRDEQAQLLSTLDESGHRIGFAIQGGVFGEGIDYVGQRLIGVLIVGTGLPAMSEETELISRHYVNTGREGFDFAYRFPGFTRVLQTAGRLIRHESDRGFVLLVDDRFAQKAYRQLYPEDWHVSFPSDLSALDAHLQSFWQQT